MSHPDLSFVFPCLNEEPFLARCIQRVRASLDGEPSLRYEIIVADNGSTDRSREIAEAQGARVVPVARRGYGAALQGGIQAARGRHVMFADADGTYLYEDALPLYRKVISENAELGVASRLRGRIEPGAMPFLHRYLGTPVLTAMINVLFRGRQTDSNSGFRCALKQAYEGWRVRSTGMEFISEIGIKALKHRCRIVEIPSGLTHPPTVRQPHLRTWRDGMRNVLFILSERPALFEWLGLLTMVLSTLLQLAAMILGPINIGGVHIFQDHSKLLLLLAGLAGCQFYLYGCMCYLKSEDRPLSISRRLINLDEGWLFFLLLGTVGGISLGLSYLFYEWSTAGFAGLHMEPFIIGAGHLLGILLLLLVGLLGLHVLKRYD